MIIVANVVSAKVKEGKLIMKTFMLKKENVEHKWYVIDAEGKTLGKVAERAAFVLRGKHKPTFTPHVACGDNVIIINAEKVVLTGDKLDSKMYYNHSGYPGGLRERTARTMVEKYPVEMVERAVRGMLPKNRLGRQIFKQLFVYAGNEHKHEAQKPERLEVK
jgi:large subunit ribosomal protein L13